MERHDEPPWVIAEELRASKAPCIRPTRFRTSTCPTLKPPPSAISHGTMTRIKFIERSTTGSRLATCGEAKRIKRTIELGQGESNYGSPLPRTRSPRFLARRRGPGLMGTAACANLGVFINSPRRSSALGPAPFSPTDTPRQSPRDHSPAGRSPSALAPSNTRTNVLDRRRSPARRGPEHLIIDPARQKVSPRTEAMAPRDHSHVGVSSLHEMGRPDDPPGPHSIPPVTSVAT